MILSCHTYLLCHTVWNFCKSKRASFAINLERFNSLPPVLGQIIAPSARSRAPPTVQPASADVRLLLALFTRAHEHTQFFPCRESLWANLFFSGRTPLARVFVSVDTINDTENPNASPQPHPVPPTYTELNIIQAETTDLIPQYWRKIDSRAADTRLLWTTRKIRANTHSQKM